VVRDDARRLLKSIVSGESNLLGDGHVRKSCVRPVRYESDFDARAGWLRQWRRGVGRSETGSAAESVPVNIKRNELHCHLIYFSRFG